MERLTLDEIIDTLNDLTAIYGGDFTGQELQALEEAILRLEDLRDEA